MYILFSLHEALDRFAFNFDLGTQKRKSFVERLIDSVDFVFRQSYGFQAGIIQNMQIYAKKKIN